MDAAKPVMLLICHYRCKQGMAAAGAASGIIAHHLQPVPPAVTIPPHPTLTMNLTHIKAVAFDLDGTLVDSIADLAASANAMRAELGLAPLAAERIQSHVGDGVASLVHRALTDSRDGQADTALWEKGFTFFIQHYHRHLTVHTKMYPGVAEGLNLLHGFGLPLVVVTNKSERLAVPLLAQLGIDSAFSLILGGDTLSEKKPSPLPLQHVAEVLGITPQQIVMVGDSENDVLCARAAGALPVAVSYGYRDAANLHADLVIDSLVELYALLKKSAELPQNLRV